MYGIGGPPRALCPEIEAGTKEGTEGLQGQPEDTELGKGGNLGHVEGPWLGADGQEKRLILSNEGPMVCPPPAFPANMARHAYSSLYLNVLRAGHIREQP